MRMVRWARGKRRLDHVRNVGIWKEAHLYPMAEFLREKMLRWFGHVQRRDKVITDGSRWKVNSRQTKVEMAKPGERGYTMTRNQMTTEMAEDRKHWHVMVQAGTLRSVEAERYEMVHCNKGHLTMEMRQLAASSMLMLSFADVSNQLMKPLCLQKSSIRVELSGVCAWSHCKSSTNTAKSTNLT